MEEEFQSSKPIYMQIADKICQQIVRNDLHPGDKLPSVREMAMQTGVNPNTIQRTYRELERMEIVESKRGQGTFVVENPYVIRTLKQKRQTEIISSFVNSLQDLGFSKEEIIASLNDYFAEREGEQNDRI
nr:GntR family transcriptional regulator [uncultured Bacillus sp.]